MLTPEMIEQNKETFIELIKSIDRETITDEMKDKLINWLVNKSDFFTAPASTKYHCNFEGGLCAHSLNVYSSLCALANLFAVEEVVEQDEEGNDIVKYVSIYDDSTLKIVSLLHDISKANFYEKYMRNVKNDVTKQWEQVEEYKTKDTADRFIFGNHEETSEFMIRTFLPLTIEESVAILHHHGGKGFDSSQTDMSVIFNKYTLATLLHLADMASTFVLEKK